MVCSTHHSAIMINVEDCCSCGLLLLFLYRLIIRVIRWLPDRLTPERWPVYLERKYSFRPWFDSRRRSWPLLEIDVAIYMTITRPVPANWCIAQLWPWDKLTASLRFDLVASFIYSSTATFYKCVECRLYSWCWRILLYIRYNHLSN